MITRIAVAEPPGIEVEYACEECDEEREAVLACYHVVHVGHDALWFCLTLCQQTEGTADICHDQCGRHTLACYITNAEVEAVVAYEVVVEVATDLLGRVHRGVEFYFRVLSHWCCLGLGRLSVDGMGHLAS